MYASTLPRSNCLRRASIRLAWYRHMPASSFCCCVFGAIFHLLLLPFWRIKMYIDVGQVQCDATLLLIWQKNIAVNFAHSVQDSIGMIKKIIITMRYDTIAYCTVYLTSSKKLTDSQLSLPHRINKNIKRTKKTKNKLMSVISPVQSNYHEDSPKIYQTINVVTH